MEETKTQVQHIRVKQVSGASGNKNYCVCNSGTGEHLEIKQVTKILRHWKHNFWDSEQRLVRPKELLRPCVSLGCWGGGTRKCLKGAFVIFTYESKHLEILLVNAMLHYMPVC